jgi:hypothetical protein
LDQLLLFYQFFVTQQVASHRVGCKLLSVLLAIFIELAQKVIWNHLFYGLCPLSHIKNKNTICQEQD